MGLAHPTRRPQELRERRSQGIDRLTKEFDGSVNTMLNGTAQAATDMHASATEQASFAQQAETKLTAVAAAAEQVKQNVQTVAAVSEELSSSIGEISRRLTEAARVSAAASEETMRTDRLVQGLAAAADRIGEIVKLIRGIASQTNLFALNATAEAARAGEAGEGFVVVGSEVKNLASQTAKATEDISVQISAVQEETRRAATAIGAITTVVDQVRQISADIASAVGEHETATLEISHNVHQAADGILHLSDDIRSVTHGAKVSSMIADRTCGTARALAGGADSLRREVTTFLVEVKKA